MALIHQALIAIVFIAKPLLPPFGPSLSKPCAPPSVRAEPVEARARWLVWAVCLGSGREPGCAPGGAVAFFCFAKRKSPKKRRPCCLRPLRCAAGQPGVLGHGVHRRTHFAATQLRSDNCGESVHEARALRRACHPPPCAPQAHTEGTHESDIHTGHRCARPHLAGASATRCAGGAERSDGPCGCLDVWLPPHLAAPAAGRLRGGMGVEAPMLRELTRRGCPSGARSAKRVPRRTPQPPRRRFAP